MSKIAVSCLTTSVVIAVSVCSKIIVLFIVYMPDFFYKIILGYLLTTKKASDIFNVTI